MSRIALFGALGVALGMAGMWAWMQRSASAPGQPKPPLVDGARAGLEPPVPPPRTPRTELQGASSPGLDPDPEHRGEDADAIRPPVPDAQQSPDWRFRLEDYQAARDAIRADDHLSPSGREAAIEHLRSERFSEAEREIIRAQDAGL